jgi:hypothetical protein
MSYSLQYAKDIFFEYKRKFIEKVNEYSQVKDRYPDLNLRDMAREIWRLGSLAEVWGMTATKLSDGEEDYLDNWRVG